MFNKKFIQFLGVILILVFHLYSRISSSSLETFIVSSAYIGVDLFFMCSAYSLSKKDHIEYISFIKDRFRHIFIKFIIFAFIYSFLIYRPSYVYSAPLYLLCIDRFLSIVSGIEFIEKGGGAFLWFLSAIMIFYILYPLFINWKNRYKTYIVFIGYIIIRLLLMYLNYDNLFILLDRVPLVLVTYIMVDKKIYIDWKYGFMMIVMGVLIMYVYRNTLNYLYGIPLCIGMAVLSRYVKENRIIDMIASASLEIYALQMMIGTDIYKLIYRFTGISFIINIILFMVIIIMGIMINRVSEKILKI
ncbi:MAG: acyltransferase family protein [Erysipelotrichaceae bacterium]|nr:acyltransferase family protein [Erysipelotrichaceae bacterium]